MEGHFMEVLLKVGVDPVHSKRLSASVRSEYLHEVHWQVFNDAPQVLEKVMALGCKNVVLSNHVPELEGLVGKLNLDRYFHRVYTSGLIGYEKPNPSIFHHVLRDLDASKDECLMVGDSFDADIAGAEQVGIKAIQVRSPNTRGWPYYFETLEDMSRGLDRGLLAEISPPGAH